MTKIKLPRTLRVSLFALSFFLLFCFFEFSNAFAGPYGFKHHLLQTDLTGSWFNSIGNYDASSKATALPGANQFTENKFTLGARYDWADSWGTFTKISYLRNSSSNSITQRSASGISDFVLGGDFLFKFWIFDWIPEISAGIPFNAVSTNMDDVMIGEGATFAQFKLYALHNYGFLQSILYSGFEYRTRSLSTLALFGIEARKETEDFIFSLGIHSISTVIKDSTTSEVDRSVLNSRVNGGSLIYNARDPSLFWFAANLAWRMEPNLAIGGGIEQTLSGTNAPYGTKFLVTINFSDFIGGGRRKLGQAKGSKYFLNSDPQSESEVEVKKGKKFRADDTPTTDESVPAEPFDVQIKRVKPLKKKR